VHWRRLSAITLPRPRLKVAGTHRSARSRWSKASMPSASPTRKALRASDFDEVGGDVDLASAGAETHRGGHIHQQLHRDADALPIDAHQPVAGGVAQAGAQIEPARVGAFEQTHVRYEFLPAAQAAARMRTRPLAGGALRQPVMEFVHFVGVTHLGVATFSMICATSASAICARRIS
jgi:hypothetical protein